MAHFYGIIEGSSDAPATRCATKEHGLTVTATSWQGSVEVRLEHDKATGRDIACVYLRRWKGTGTNVKLYEGPVSGINLDPLDRKEP